MLKFAIQTAFALALLSPLALAENLKLTVQDCTPKGTSWSDPKHDCVPSKRKITLYAEFFDGAAGGTKITSTTGSEFNVTYVLSRKGGKDDFCKMLPNLKKLRFSVTNENGQMTEIPLGIEKRWILANPFDMLCSSPFDINIVFSQIVPGVSHVRVETLGSSSYASNPVTFFEYLDTQQNATLVSMVDTFSFPFPASERTNYHDLDAITKARTPLMKGFADFLKKISSQEQRYKTFVKLMYYMTTDFVTTAGSGGCPTCDDSVAANNKLFSALYETLTFSDYDNFIQYLSYYLNFRNFASADYFGKASINVGPKVLGSGTSIASKTVTRGNLATHLDQLSSIFQYFIVTGESRTGDSTQLKRYGDMITTIIDTYKPIAKDSTEAQLINQFSTEVLRLVEIYKDGFEKSDYAAFEKRLKSEFTY